MCMCNKWNILRKTFALYKNWYLKKTCQRRIKKVKEPIILLAPCLVARSLIP